MQLAELQCPASESMQLFVSVSIANPAHSRNMVATLLLLACLPSSTTKSSKRSSRCFRSLSETCQRNARLSSSSPFKNLANEYLFYRRPNTSFVHFCISSFKLIPNVRSVKDCVVDRAHSFCNIVLAYIFEADDTTGELKIEL